MKFTKMHGLGNDFIVLQDDGRTQYNDIAKKLCDRNTGIGADGLLIVCKSDVADVKMRIINSDGSEAQMCGNGIRCFAKYVFERHIVGLSNEGSCFEVETMAGIMSPRLNLENGKVRNVTVNMGKPSFDAAKLPMIYDGEFVRERITAGDKAFTATAVLMGVPHLIVFDDVSSEEILKYGSEIEHLPLFPNRTNVDFIKVIDRKNIAVTTWERACGLTLACGTGSCASTVACIKSGLVDNEVTVHIALGTLNIKVSKDGTVYMTGDACEVFDGDISID